MEISIKDKVTVTTKLDENIRDLAVQVAHSKGIDLSEHVRSLIIKDLDDRRLLDSRLKLLLAQ